MTTAAVAVTGIGLITPAGIGAARNWRRLLTARPTAATDPELAGLRVDIACRVPDFDPERLLDPKLVWRLDRSVQFALIAAHEAVADAGLAAEQPDPTRTAVVMGTGFGGISSLQAQHARLLRSAPARVSPLTVPMSLSNMAAGCLAIEFGTQGPNLSVSTACAAGATAIGVARDLLLCGRADVALAGGTEACVTPLIVAGFAKMGALSSRTGDPAGASRPFDRFRDGFVIGEGAGVLVLETQAHARARGAHIRALISGYGASADAHHPTAPHPDGTGLEHALRAALADAGLADRDITYTNTHGTSTRLNDTVEATTLVRVLGSQATITSTKGVTGHLLGAAGAVEAAYTVLSVQHHTIPPTANLTTQDPAIHADVVTSPRPGRIRAAVSNSMGFGGQNAVLAFTAA
ncbi:beta-ketoacyl-[acyl-carrier-protein] synthase family protein [Streptomyces sp. CT34]|uniref:beta-ketoacyl-[acyl-carrier-protein] synthase family protein n=1 Tax=Streptomyces sp. CT34 TaxID=1553907 RepID=UPI0005BA38A6|nr:beta-ketoacyl-[acyl-carrier-protein] synthase family protein [Streptomyces sp. CT34]